MVARCLRIGSGRGARARLVATRAAERMAKPRKEIAMSKYDKLWGYVETQEGDELTLTFDEIGAIAGVPLDHSFLNYKKELLPHGWEVAKISLKQQAVRFKRLAE